ncbi:DUF2231 domain-containing protein [Phytohabitans sp. ZYX-F-186]|uniref:DUF2231 domain-containing protein n=1 Tax=Phytohabitans maris TaxID=3071409 RepID=A0ABU0ZGE0_9ACTN|nr:DUF2231 domain-containing protein [Phytohabitans sp. ZYX-F-186]MDQ7906116.1 DUF2231 domain-containing protein [Phytohabitans sp. ZYX-F-186]
MFEEFMGIPAHPLLIHAAVVFVPLLALAAVGYAILPFLRPHIRLVLAGLAVVGPVSALLAKLSGDAFFERMRERDRVTEGFVPVIERHQDFGEMTLWASLALGVVTLALVYFVRPTAAAAGPGGTRAVSVALSALSVLAAAAALYYVVRTGDSGAKAVWEGQ